jgi:hypothetical protein
VVCYSCSYCYFSRVKISFVHLSLSLSYEICCKSETKCSQYLPTCIFPHKLPQLPYADDELEIIRSVGYLDFRTRYISYFVHLIGILYFYRVPYEDFEIITDMPAQLSRRLLSNGKSHKLFVFFFFLFFFFG